MTGLSTRGCSPCPIPPTIRQIGRINPEIDDPNVAEHEPHRIIAVKLCQSNAFAYGRVRRTALGAQQKVVGVAMRGMRRAFNLLQQACRLLRSKKNPEHSFIRHTLALRIFHIVAECTDLG